MALAHEEQPQEDIHQWHIKNLIEEQLSREDAKVRFFAWLYNYDSNKEDFRHYRRDDLLAEWYKEGYAYTPFKRKIKVDKRKALNYIIQSTTADLVLDRAIMIDKYLENKKSFIAFIVHDEVVVDLSDEEKDLVPELKQMFSNNQLGNFLVNLKCGKNYYDLKELSL